jgi:hypothetical protein
MNAAAAKQIAIDSVTDQIKEVQTQIKKAAETGNLSVGLQNLKPATKEWLTENGFKVEHSDTSDFGIDDISW